jgi:hypothetical protein
MYRLGNPLLERTIVIGRLKIQDSAGDFCTILRVKRHHIGLKR